MRRACVIRCNRLALIDPIIRFLDNIKVKYDVVNIQGMTLEEVKSKTKVILRRDYDRIIITNGTALREKYMTDFIRERKPQQKMFFAELGWLPYSRFMFLDPKGIGNNSEIYEWGKSQCETQDLPEMPFRNNLRVEMDRGEHSIPWKDYILVPLQVDKDSKMVIGSPHFNRMTKFITYLIELIPKSVKILFKNHPDNRKPVRVSKTKNAIDITKSNYSKTALIKGAMGVFGINSTFLLESLMLHHKKVISFGLDVFSNKGIVGEGFGKSFDEIMSFESDTRVIDPFLSKLMSRQLYRINCADSPGQHKTSMWNKGF